MIPLEVYEPDKWWEIINIFQDDLIKNIFSLMKSGYDCNQLSINESLETPVRRWKDIAAVQYMNAKWDLIDL